MKVEQFEKAIIDRKLTPIHLFLSKGSHVKWFACKDGRHDLVIYDSGGKAYASGDWQEEEPLKKIEKSPFGVVFNCSLATRRPELDIQFEDVQKHSSCPSCSNSPTATEK